MVTATRKDYNRYFKDLQYEKAPGTADAYTYTIRKYLSFLNGKKPGQETAEDFLETFKEKNNKARSLARHITALRHFFMWMKDNRMWRGDLPRLKTPYLQRTLPPYVTEGEFIKLANGATHPKVRAALALTYGAGFRLSEACNTMVEDVNEEEGFIRVLGKGGKEGFVPVEEEVIQMIKPWRDYIKHKSKYLFPGQDPRKPQRKNGFQALIRNHMKRCGIKGKSVHSLRHGAATSLYGRGLDIRQIQEFLRHENIATTAIYTHMTPGRLRKSILKVRRFG